MLPCKCKRINENAHFNNGISAATRVLCNFIDMIGIEEKCKILTYYYEGAASSVL